MEHTYYYYYSNYDIDKYIIISRTLYIFYNGLNKQKRRSEAKNITKIMMILFWTEVTKIRKSKSNNFKSDLSPLYTIKKNDALSETK